MLQRMEGGRREHPVHPHFGPHMPEKTGSFGVAFIIVVPVIITIEALESEQLTKILCMANVVPLHKFN